MIMFLSGPVAWFRNSAIIFITATVDAIIIAIIA